jgi:hypothetical protein
MSQVHSVAHVPVHSMAGAGHHAASVGLEQRHQTGDEAPLQAAIKPAVEAGENEALNICNQLWPGVAALHAGGVGPHG